jgi:glycosyltransferase involved in cell wall biosynthesis
MIKQELPLVSVVCLCYNHSKYVIESINSVLNQTYANVELIIVNDASTDNSDSVIKKFLIERPGINYISLKTNHGNCKAFNLGWAASSGEYIIDLAADDILLEERVAVGVKTLLASGDTYGVNFADAIIIDEIGNRVKEHKTEKLFKEAVPEGYIFKELLSKYFINPATMMYTNALLKSLGGYDESLAYEDFDLWIRSSKKFKYCYSNQELVAKRVLNASYGRSQYRPGSRILRSTWLVCEKAFLLCTNTDEYEALIVRINYEMKMAVFSLNLFVASKLFKLKKQVLKELNAREF